MSGFPVHQYLLEFAQVHVHSIGDALFCLQSFPASGSFPKSWLFVSGGQSIGKQAYKELNGVIVYLSVHSVSFNDQCSVVNTLDTLR